MKNKPQQGHMMPMPDKEEGIGFKTVSEKINQIHSEFPKISDQLMTLTSNMGLSSNSLEAIPVTDSDSDNGSGRKTLPEHLHDELSIIHHRIRLINQIIESVNERIWQ